MSHLNSDWRSPVQNLKAQNVFLKEKVTLLTQEMIDLKDLVNFPKPPPQNKPQRPPPQPVPSDQTISSASAVEQELRDIHQEPESAAEAHDAPPTQEQDPAARQPAEVPYEPREPQTPRDLTAQESQDLTPTGTPAISFQEAHGAQSSLEPQGPPAFEPGCPGRFPDLSQVREGGRQPSGAQGSDDVFQPVRDSNVRFEKKHKMPRKDPLESIAEQPPDFAAQPSEPASVVQDHQDVGPEFAEQPPGSAEQFSVSASVVQDHQDVESHNRGSQLDRTPRLVMEESLMVSSRIMDPRIMGTQRTLLPHA